MEPLVRVKFKFFGNEALSERTFGLYVVPRQGERLVWSEKEWRVVTVCHNLEAAGAREITVLATLV